MNGHVMRYGAAAVAVAALGLGLSSGAAHGADRNPPRPQPPCTAKPTGLQHCAQHGSIPRRPPEASPTAPGRINLAGDLGVRELVSDLVRAALEEQSVNGGNRIALPDGYAAYWSRGPADRPELCGHDCVSRPFMTYERGFDWYAQLNLSPRFALRIVKRVPGTSAEVPVTSLTVSIPIAYKVRCAGWVTRSGQIEAWFVQGFPRFDRHTSGLEDVIDFFTGITDEFNRKIQRTLNEMAGAGRQAVDLVLLPEKRSCSSIAARAGAAWEDDAIVYDFGRLTPPPTTLPGKN